MKKKFIYSFLLMLIMPLCLIFGGCGDNDNSKPLATIDGCEIQSVVIYKFSGGYANVEIGVENKTNQTKNFDFSKVILKVNNETLLEHNGDIEEYTANKYLKKSFQIDNYEDAVAGNSVSVYYENQFLTTITIQNF
ncbi:MAG: hypothetical protein IJW32_02165 [Clostridia bacterium]|nr:hypothetical protein [Clostridia bacterium]